MQYKAELVQEFTKTAIPEFASGKLTTIVDSVFPMDQIQLAHKRMEANENIGKIVIQMPSKEQEKTRETKSEL